MSVYLLNEKVVVANDMVATSADCCCTTGACCLPNCDCFGFLAFDGSGRRFQTKTVTCVLDSTSDCSPCNHTHHVEDNYVETCTDCNRVFFDHEVRCDCSVVNDGPRPASPCPFVVCDDAPLVLISQTATTQHYEYHDSTETVSKDIVLSNECSPDPEGVCTITSEDDCNGDYQGDGTTCDPNPCAEFDTGACCFVDDCGTDCYTVTGCSNLTGPDCFLAGGAFHGVGTSCDNVDTLCGQVGVLCCDPFAVPPDCGGCPEANRGDHCGDC